MPPFPFSNPGQRAVRGFPVLIGFALLGLGWVLELAAGNIGQIGQPLSWVELPDESGRRLAVQWSADDRIVLTPDESFFPRLGLAAEGEGPVPDEVSLNGGRSFAAIGRWDPGDVATWGLWFTRSGKLEVTITMTGGAAPSRYAMLLDGQSLPFHLPADEEVEIALSLSIPTPGLHELSLRCLEGGGGVSFSRAEIRGPAAEKSGVVRKRWRPAAAHTKFSSSNAPKSIRLWVMEMDARPGELNFYCPITTPFGYYGPSWRADGTVNAGFNFSLWSFGRGKPEPPVEQLSHLLAIGNPDARFGGFDHEGTGVKIRDWEPLAGRQGQRQVLALRVEPGPRYDTYISYFYAADEKRWRLFGVGNKWNGGKPLSSLWVGSFVEVPGPPPVQRTGAWERRMRYRGWVRDQGGDWHALDRMNRGNVDRETGLTHTDRGVTDDGWFYLQTGGWYFREAERSGEVALPNPVALRDVPYLDEAAIAYLTSLPSGITATRLERVDSRAHIAFHLEKPGPDPEITLFWGPEEGLTLADRWAHQVSLQGPFTEGENQFTLEDIPAETPLHVRLLLRNKEGQFWTPTTLSENP